MLTCEDPIFNHEKNLPVNLTGKFDGSVDMDGL